jgi:hypothetical protein
MDQTAHERLTALADTYKKQQFKLTKPEIEEAANLLAQVLTASLGPDHDTADAFIRALPADSTTKAIGDSWSQLPDAIKRHLLKTLPNLNRTDRFDRLKLLAGAAILDAEPKDGTTFLCTSCSSLASRSGSHFSGEVVQIFRKALLEGDEPKIYKLVITAHPSAVTGALLNLIVSALLANSPQAPALAPVFQLPALKWFFTSQAYTRLKPAHQTQLVEALKRWDTTLQSEVRKTLDALPAGLPPGFEFLLAPLPPKEPAIAATAAPPSQATAAPSQPEKQPLPWKVLLAELTSQITKLDQELHAARELSEKHQAEIQTLRTSFANAETHIKNLGDELGKKAEENERNSQNLAAAQATATEAKQRAEALEAIITELKQTHEQQVQLLTSRIETEAAHRLESFQHSLANTLRVDYGHFQLCEGKPFTPEITQGLQMLVSGIFDRLQRHGINARE